MAQITSNYDGMNGSRIQNGATNSTQTDEVAVLNGKAADTDSYGEAIPLLDEAIAVYDKVLSIDTDHLDALNNKALALLDMRRNKEAIAVYDKVLGIIPNDVAALNSKGLALLDSGRYNEAILIV